MSTTAILIASIGGTAGLAGIVAGVALVASPINNARDARRHAIQTADTDAHAATLLSQIRAGAETAAHVDPDVGKLAYAAHAAAAGLANHLAACDRPFVERILSKLQPILDVEYAPTPPPLRIPPIAGAVVLQVLLHRLTEVCDGPRYAQVAAAGGYVTEAIRTLPDGRAIDFNPLTEHDPLWLRQAQAEWVAVAQWSGMGGWIRALPA